MYVTYRFANWTYARVGRMFAISITLRIVITNNNNYVRYDIVLQFVCMVPVSSQYRHNRYLFFNSNLVGLVFLLTHSKEFRLKSKLMFKPKSQVRYTNLL